MDRVAGGGSILPEKSRNHRKIRLTINRQKRHKTVDSYIHISTLMLASGLIKLLIPAATKATVAGGSGVTGDAINPPENIKKIDRPDSSSAKQPGGAIYATSFSSS